MSCRSALFSGLAVVASMLFPAATLGAPEAVPVQQAALHVASPDAIARSDTFAYTVITPQRASGRVMVLMHGSGGDETTLVKLARRIDPHATLVGIRGRVVQNGVKRWYRRLSPTEFDQQDVRAEAAAFIGFLAELSGEVDLSGATFLGYSNGANLIAAVSLLHPDTIRKAVLLRAMPVLSEPPAVDLSGSRILTIAGENDRTYFPFAPKLEELLRSCGAMVDARRIGKGHGIGEADAQIVAEWLGAAPPKPASD